MMCHNGIVPGIGAPCSDFWLYLYWISTSCAYISSIHVLMCTVYIAVYGQGLALRGPLGSMVRVSITIMHQ